MTKLQAETIFKATRYLDTIRAYGRKDKPALRESWGVFTDMLCKSGQITQRQYERWTYPKYCK